MEYILEDDKNIKHEIERDDFYNCDVYHVFFGYLEIGNNYTIDHFIKFLKQQRQDVIDYVEALPISTSDDIIFHYHGKYGLHKDSFCAIDYFDIVK